jgi:hypothetical protein
MSADAVWRRAVFAAIAEAKELPISTSEWSPSRPAEETVRRVEWLLRSIQRDDLPAPYTQTTPDGGIHLTWRQQNGELDLQFYPDGSVEFLFDQAGNLIEGEITEDPRQADELLESLFVRPLA